jgi:hypothetical protein
MRPVAALEEKTKADVAVQRFSRAKTWKSETELVSKVTKRILHAADQKIIGMGETAIPLFDFISAESLSKAYRLPIPLKCSLPGIRGSNLPAAHRKCRAEPASPPYLPCSN